MSGLLSAVTKFRGRKRGLVEATSPTSDDYDSKLSAALNDAINDSEAPVYIKSIVESLLYFKDRLGSLASENEKLYSELRYLREENTRLLMFRRGARQSPLFHPLLNTIYMHMTRLLLRIV